MNRTVAEVIIFLAIVLGFFVVQSQIGSTARKQDTAQAQATQAGCIRTNAGVRRPLYEFLTAAIEASRQRAAAATDQPTRTANLVAAENYKHIRAEEVQAVEDVARAPGSPEVKCLEAFPLP